jgi:hypothetical protein
MEYRTIEQWSFEQANAEQQEFSESLPSYRGPIYRWAAFRYLENLEAEYLRDNHGFAVLAGVRKCANHDLVMPDWLAKAFISRYDLVLNCHTDSWDKAFDPPYKKGVHLNALRKQRKLRFAVLNEVHTLRMADSRLAIDKALFEKVGRKFGLGATLAERYYYSVQHLLKGANPLRPKRRRG